MSKIKRHTAYFLLKRLKILLKGCKIVTICYNCKRDCYKNVTF